MQSVADLLDRVEGDAHTLTVYNHDGSDDVIEAFRDHFGRRNVAYFRNGRAPVSSSGVDTVGTAD